MNKFLAFAWFFVIALTSQAQEGADTLGQPQNYEGATWSPEVKMWLLVIFSAVTVIVILRTFRGKADV